MSEFEFQVVGVGVAAMQDASNQIIEPLQPAIVPLISNRVDYLPAHVAEVIQQNIDMNQKKARRWTGLKKFGHSNDQHIAAKQRMTNRATLSFLRGIPIASNMNHLVGNFL